MRSSLLLGLVATVSAGHVSIPLSRQRSSHSSPHDTRDDASPINLKAINNITGGGYYSDFEIGTPPQKISFMLDTGSSDTWVNSVDADLCKSTRLQSKIGFCETQFNPDDSDSFETVQRGGFNITYLDGRNIVGDYFKDTVTLGDAKVKNQQLGLALKSVRPTGIMGLGFSSNVAADKEYSTIIDNMVKQGVIDTAAFSLYLNDLETDAGSILFGGIDKKKFTGDLVTLPLISDPQSGSAEITSYNVHIEGFSVKTSNGKTPVDIDNLSSRAVLDSGSTISLLPDDQVRPLWREFGIVYALDMNAPLIDCAYAGEKGDGYVLEFKFRGKTIRVPMAEMVIDPGTQDEDAAAADPDFRDWDGVCMFGIGATSDFGVMTSQFTLLGDTFLRSAYVVYDLANEQLAIAQASLNATESDIVEIPSGKLPKVTGDGDGGDNGDSGDSAVGRTTPPAVAVALLGLLSAFMVAL